MSRLPNLRYDDLDSAGKEVWDAIVGTRGADLLNEDGGLIGPFNAFVHAPGVGRRMSALGAQLRFKTSIERRLSELAIITVASRWQAGFEWWAHAPAARQHGVAEPIVAAIEAGAEPQFEAEDERIVYRVASQLATTGRVDAPTYAAAQQLLGDEGTVELVSLCGYYTAISFLLNAFEVRVPD